MFLLTFNNLVPDPLPVDSAYIPRVFGFRVHQSVRQQNNSNVAALTASALRSNNGRRSGGVVDSFTSQRVVNVAKSNAVEEGGEDDAKDRTGTEVEIKSKKKCSDVGDAEGKGDDKSKSGESASKGAKKGAAANGDGVAKEEKLGENGGEGSTSKRKSKEGDNSAVSNNENGGSTKSRSSKRQKRQAGSEVT